MAKISVIVPVYKVEPYLRRCVDSIRAQTFRDFELILVEDGSPDNCGKICDEYAKRDPRIMVIHQANGGLSAARNAGIDLAMASSSSQWMTFVDSDDWINPRMLNVLVDACQQTCAEVSVCMFERVSQCSEKTEACDQIGIETAVYEPEEFWVWCHDYCKTGLFTSNVAWGKLYSKKLFENIRYPEEIMAHEDVFTTYKLLFAAKKIAVVSQELYYYFVNTEGITKNCWTPARLGAVYGGREQMLFFEHQHYKRALMVATAWHLDRLQWNYCSAKEARDTRDVVERLCEVIVSDFDRCRRLLSLRTEQCYTLAKIAHPIFARFVYPFSRFRGAMVRRGFLGAIRHMMEV